MLLRRSLLGAALAITGCATTTADQLQADANLLVSGLSSVLVTLKGLSDDLRPSDAVLAQIHAALDDIAANAATIGTLLAPNQTVAQRIANGVSTIAGLATPFFPLAPTLAAIFQAAFSLVSYVLATAKAPVPAATSARGGLSPSQARKILARAS